MKEGCQVRIAGLHDQFVFYLHYRENLRLVKELGDKAAQGRACGNLGNTHYLLGNFKLAIRYHEEVCAFRTVIYIAESGNYHPLHPIICRLLCNRHFRINSLLFAVC